MGFAIRCISCYNEPAAKRLNGRHSLLAAQRDDRQSESPPHGDLQITEGNE
jgi:hypothetical protein